MRGRWGRRRSAGGDTVAPAADATARVARSIAHQPFHSGCYAPFVSMHLDPRGHVRVCCMNEWQSLGIVGDESLMDIWTGHRAAELRRALADDRFHLGCERCAAHLSSPQPDLAYLRVFDPIVATTMEPEWPRRLELALSNTCNLQCVMCNGDLSSSIRSQREHRPPLPTVYDDEFFAELTQFLPHLDSITFLGGEPFLARETLRIFDLLEQLGLTPHCHVTTNGTQWNERIRSIVERTPMHVAVSIDALSPDLAESIRVGVDHARVLDNIDRFRRSTTAERSGTSLAFCLMRSNWSEFRDVLDWADDCDLDVFVNAVAYPTRFSLAHAPLDELRGVVEGLDGRARRRSSHGRHGRNDQVWARELAGLHALLESRSATEHRARAARPSDGPDTEVAVTLAGIATSSAPAWSSARLTVDEHDVVIGVDVEEAHERLDMTWLLGRSLRDLVTLLTNGLGDMSSSEMLPVADGVEDRRLRFGNGADVTDVRVLLEPGDGTTQTWRVSVARSDPLVEHPS